MLPYLLLAVGLILLIIGGDFLVRGSVGLAEKLSVPPLVIGLTIVAFGTSAPELFISVKAALSGASGIAIGNVVGSNIANVLLVIGIPALIAASRCDDEGIGRNMLVMLGFTVVYMGMMLDGVLSRLEGAILLGLLVLYLTDQFRAARNAAARAAAEGKNAEDVDLLDYHDEVPNVPTSNLVIALLIFAGLIGLPLGAEITVDSAVEIAQRWNVSDAVIGLTIVAIGTSLPELATGLVAVMRGNSSIAIGNVVGSNIFNIGSIMGFAAIISPMSVGDRILRLDMWVMLACAVLLAILAHWKLKIGKRVGVALSALYAIYVVSAFAI